MVERLLKYFETHEGTPEEEGYRWLEFKDEEEQKFYTELWDFCFIGSHWKLDALRQLHEAGFRTHTWERDSFGILIAGITKDGKAISLG